MPARGAISVGLIPVTRTPTNVLQHRFLSSPRSFEASQARIRERSSAEIQDFKTGAGEVLDGPPHYEIVGADFLEGFIRSTEFIYHRVAELKEERAGCRFSVHLG